MNLNKVIQTIFIMLAVVGVFAAMARNGYGFDFIGVACLGLAALFLMQLVWKLVNELGTLSRNDIPEMAELLLLSLLLLMFGLRAFYIYVNYGDVIFNLIIGLQIPVYLILGSFAWSEIKKENPSQAFNVVSLFASVFVFLLSLLVRTNAFVFVSLGILAVAVALPFIITVIRQKQFESKSKTITLLQYVVASKNKAGLLFIFFVATVLFSGLGYLKVIPTIQNAEQPKDYIELINRAESGQEKLVNGKYQHEKYKGAMDRFLERQGKK